MEQVYIDNTDDNDDVNSMYLSSFSGEEYDEEERKVDQEGRALPKAAAAEFCIFSIPKYSKTFQRILFPVDLSMIDCSSCVPLHLQKTIECICDESNICGPPPLVPKQYHCISDMLVANGHEPLGLFDLLGLMLFLCNIKQIIWPSYKFLTEIIYTFKKLWQLPICELC